MMQKLKYLKNSQSFVFIVILILFIVSTHSINAQNTCSFQLENSDFEQPDILSVYGTNSAFVPEDKLPAWNTTSPDNIFEVWRSGYLGVPAYSGKQFIEINAHNAAAVYNDATSVPGSTITFGFAHRGRDGVDKIELKMGPPGGPYVSKGIYSTGNSAWKYYTTSYTVPAGQNTTRFIFEAFSSAGGITIGNFLDDINVIDIDIEMNVSGSSVCGESKGKIEITGKKPAGVILEYSIDNVNFQSSNVFNDLPLGNYTVYLKANGICIRNKNVTIPPSKGISVSLGNLKNICEGGTVVLDAGSDAVSYLWNTGATTRFLSVNTSNIYSVEITDAKGCKGNGAVGVKVNPNPSVILGPDKEICEGTSINLDAGNSGASYLWNNGATTQSITVNKSSNYSVVVTDSKGCKGNDDIAIFVNPKPTVNLGGDKLFCPGETISLDAGVSGNNYLWNTGATTQQINVNTSGTYSVNVTDSKGCTGNASVKLIPKIWVDLGLDTTICKGNSLILNAKNNGVTYLWSTGENTQSIIVNKAGTFEVELSDGLGCKVKDQITVYLDSLINPYLNFDTTFCQGQSLFLKYNKPTYNTSWLNYANVQEIKIYTSGNYAAILSNEFCKDTFDVRVNIMDTLPAQIIQQGNNGYYCFKEDTAVLEIWVNGSANYTINWEHNFSREPSIKVNKAGVYTATVNNGNCISRLSTKVTEYCEPTFYLPNAFSPNYDDLNDYFPPHQTGNYQEFRMEIFNRWGEQIYSNHDINMGWDGTIAGKEAQIDVYVYKISYSYFNENQILKRRNKTGTVTLVR